MSDDEYDSDASHASHEEYELKIQQLKQKIELKDKAIDEAVRQDENNGALIKDLEAQAQFLRSINEDLRQKLENCGDSSAENKELQNQLKSNLEEQAALRTQLKDLEGRYEQKRAALKSAEYDLEMLAEKHRVEIQDTAIEIGSLQEQLAFNQKACNDNIEYLQGIIEETNDKYFETANNLVKELVESRRLATLKAECEQKLAKAETEIAQERMKWTNDLLETQKEKWENQTEIDKLKEELDNLNSLYTQEVHNVTMATIENENLEHALASIRSHHLNLQTISESMQERLEWAARQNEFLTERLVGLETLYRAQVTKILAQNTVQAAVQEAVKQQTNRALMTAKRVLQISVSTQTRRVRRRLPIAPKQTYQARAGQVVSHFASLQERVVETVATTMAAHLSNVLASGGYGQRRLALTGPPPKIDQSIIANMIRAIDAKHTEFFQRLMVRWHGGIEGQALRDVYGFDYQRDGIKAKTVFLIKQFSLIMLYAIICGTAAIIISETLLGDPARPAPRPPAYLPPGLGDYVREGLLQGVRGEASIDRAFVEQVGSLAGCDNLSSGGYIGFETYGQEDYGRLE